MRNEEITAAFLYEEVLSKNFDVTKYDVAKDFNIAQWADELTSRYHLFDIVQRFDERGSEYQLDRVHATKKTIENPFDKRGEGFSFGVPSRMISSISDMVASDYYYAGHDIANEKFADVRAACEKQNQSFEIPVHEVGPDDELTPEERRLIASSFDDLHLERLGEPFWIQRIDVDLDCSDETLIRDFKEWLAGKRKKLGDFYPPRKNTIGKKEFDAWCDMRFLAYLDIRMILNWWDIDYKELSRKQYATLLFPKHTTEKEDRCETVRKTLHDNYFETYFNSKFLTQLQQEARLYLSRRRPRAVE